MTALAPWLSLIGIGEDGLVGLTPSARARLENARQVHGAKRHLALIPYAPQTDYREWTGDLRQALVTSARANSRIRSSWHQAIPFCSVLTP
ncbi:MAG: hypothetical protein AAYR33_10295 [Acetobacteraceae bacterium]